MHVTNLLALRIDSRGEVRFFAGDEIISQLATQYVDENGMPSMDIAHNPNGSLGAIEGITSPCGRVLGKMGHTERSGKLVAKNIPGPAPFTSEP